jgi:sugar lactone lactonase YvrE
MKTYHAELFLAEQFNLAESPFYDEKSGRLSWVNITEGEIHILYRDGRRVEAKLGQMIGAAVPLPDRDAFLVAATDGLYLYESGAFRMLQDLKSVYKAYQRSNDAKLDPAGHLVFGSVVFDGKHEMEGNLYRFKNETVEIIWENTKLSNGMAWSKDGKKFFFSDSGERKVFSFDYDAGSGLIANRKVLFEVTEGVPDGMCIDEKDNLYVAIWGGSRIECHNSKTGAEIARIEVPAKQVSSCCFYGSQKKLFITSAREGQDGEFDGCLFTCDLGGRS